MNIVPSRTCWPSDTSGWNARFSKLASEMRSDSNGTQERWRSEPQKKGNTTSSINTAKKRKGKRKRSKMEVAEKQGQQASRRLDRGTKGGRRRTEDTKLEDRHRRLDLGARSLRPPSLRLEEPPQQRGHNAVPNPDRNDPVRERVAWQNHQKDQTQKEGKTKKNSPEENSKRPRSSAVSHHAGSPTRPCQTTLLDLPTSANASPTVLFASRSTAHSGTEMSAALVVKYSGSVKLDVKMFK
jgi:hypothetical protein